MVRNSAASGTHGHGQSDSLEGVRWGTPAARWILVATVLGSGIAFLDVTVVNVALPSIGLALDINNAISRGAGLMAVAVIPGLAGLTGDAYREPAIFTNGFRTAMLMSAALSAAGGALAWLLIRNAVAGRAQACPFDKLDRRHCCAIDGTPVATARDASQACTDG